VANLWHKATGDLSSNRLTPSSIRAYST